MICPSLARQLEKKAKKEAETNKYRNRAKERQLDINPDYQDLQSYENVDAEKSKYLGGEISRTHLVKGLDEVLLKKVKEEQERDIDEKLDRSFYLRDPDIVCSKHFNVFFLPAWGRSTLTHCAIALGSTLKHPKENPR